MTIAPYSLTTVVLTPGSSSTPTPTPTHTPVPTPSPTTGITPTHTPTKTPVTGTACSVHYVVTNQWPGGFGANLTITNTGTATINGWSLQFSFANGQTITQGWNGSFTQQGSAVTVTNLSYNGSIAPGTSVSPGFNGSWTTSNAAPTSFKLNGIACSIV